MTEDACAICYGSADIILVYEIQKERKIDSHLLCVDDIIHQLLHHCVHMFLYLLIPISYFGSFLLVCQWRLYLFLPTHVLSSKGKGEKE